MATMRRTSEIFVYLPIDAPDGITAKSVADQLKTAGRAEVHIRINSPGGSVFEGLAIYNALSEYPGRIVVHVDAAALSIASVVAMAGDEIVMAENAFLMIHNPTNATVGDAEQLRRDADLLGRIESQLAAIYAKRTKQSPEQIQMWMAQEKWFDAAEALAAGFVDSVSPAMEVAASFDMSGFHNVPKQIMARIQKGNDMPPTTQAATTNEPLDVQAEQSRVAMIRASFDGCQFSDAARERAEVLRNEAILNKQSPEDFNASLLSLIRASRPTGPAIHAGGRPATGEVLQAALLLHMGQEKVAIKAFGETATQQGRDLRIGSMVDWLRAVGRSEGRDVSGSKDTLIRNEFSTVSTPILLSGVANKILEQSYRAYPSAARQVARVLSANDFKTHTGIRLTGDAMFQEVGADGELKHGNLTEQSFTFKIGTHGRMFGINRQAVINDDLGAFAEVPMMLGRGAAGALESAFWTLVLANTGSFFGTANKNYIDGAGSALSLAGLGLGVAAMRTMVDDQQEPISVVPRFLVVPPELETTADQLFASTNVIVSVATGEATATLPDSNPYKGKYQPLVTPHLSNAKYAGYSATGWYLFGDPADVAAFGIAYLNGMETPTIEQIDQPPNVLGVGWRGWLDFGICQIDKHGAVMSKGKA